MLVLTRKTTEGITIGPNIRVVVLDIKGGQVRLGIEAPHAVQVHRDEVYARILEENKQAALVDDIALPAFTQLKDLVKKKA
ncbi:MAG: csrA [Nitrospira sp.]|jgi:carbon storage regulator|nr:csrA [Nitrospira sp.]